MNIITPTQPLIHAAPAMAQGFTRLAGGKMIRNRDGSWTATEKFTCNYDVAVMQAPEPFVDRHPFVPWLICDHVEIDEELVTPETAQYETTRLPTGPALVTVVYTGIQGYATRPVVSFYNETYQEAIETHKRFISDIAGTPDAPLNGAVFDKDTGEFRGFGVAKIWPTSFVEQSRYAGVTGWEAPQPIKAMVWATRDPRVRLYAQSVWEGGSVGGIAADGCLLRKFDVEQEGGCYRVRQEWLQPGPRFINDGILYPRDPLGCPTDINAWDISQ